MSERDLWADVVFQAAEDVRTEDYASVLYGDAVSFFVAPGWAESRQNIADCLELHPDDLIRLGRAAIAERHLRDGPPPVIERVAGSASHSTSGLRSRSATIPRPEPLLTKPVELPKLQSAAAKETRARRDVAKPSGVELRDWHIQKFLAKHAA